MNDNNYEAQSVSDVDRSEHLAGIRRSLRSTDQANNELMGGKTLIKRQIAGNVVIAGSDKTKRR